MKEKAKSILVVVVKCHHCANGLFFSQSLVTVPEVFAKVNSSQIPSLFWFAACWCPKPTNSFVAIERFHMTSQRLYWCSKTMKRRPCWCSNNPVGVELFSYVKTQLETDQSGSSATKAPFTHIWIFLKTEIFLLRFQKYTRSHVAYSNRFRPSIKNVKQWKSNASSKWCTTSSYSKTSVFVRPHVNERPAFSKIFSLENVFGDQKTLRFQTKTDTCGRGQIMQYF